MTYLNCKKLIEANRYEYEDMKDKLETFLLASRITETQYEELMRKITK